MPHHAPPLTSTMAKVYAEQGYLRKAALIYRRLLEKDPAHADWLSALADLERRIAQQRAPSRKENGLLMREWIDLMKTSHDPYAKPQAKH